MFNRSLVFHRTRPAAGMTVIAALVLATGCAKQDETKGSDRHDQDVAWARAALERNPQLEVVATDTDARTFTVKHRGTGAVQVVSLDKLAAIPVADLTGSSTTAPAVAPAAAPEATPSAPAQPIAAAPPPSAPPAESAASPSAPGESSYTIQREGGQLRVSGPGVSIVSANAASSRTAAAADTAAADSPIVCEDGRFLHLDRRNIRVNGTAVIARNGCELHITNSTIDATGAAISAVDATVHIANSEVSGQAASVEASGRAKLFVRSSTFRGIARRNDPAEINDQGGNTWR